MRSNVGSTERIARLIVGGVLVLAALRWLEGRWTRRLAMATGGELLATAAAGWCPGNAAIGRNSAEEGSESVDSLADMPA